MKTLEKIQVILTLLSDGQFHSGQSIAQKMNVSRTAVWKLIKKIQSWQLEVFSIQGKGYQIPGGLELIDSTRLFESMQKQQSLFQQVTASVCVDSTADCVAKKWQQNPGVGCVYIAEYQTKGRGRKGQPWISPFGANLYFSIGIELPLGLSALGGLSLAIGISLANALNPITNQVIKIKWPNDLLVNDKKLAGILVEASGDHHDTSFLNIGVGLNWNMQAHQANQIDQPWVNLKPLLKSGMSRNDVLEFLLCAIDCGLKKYLSQGFSVFKRSWPSISYSYGKPVRVLQNSANNNAQEIFGIEAGIETTGALKLQTEHKVKIFHSGEVSLRKT